MYIKQKSRISSVVLQVCQYQKQAMIERKHTDLTGLLALRHFRPV